MKPTIGLVIASYKYGHLAAHAIETAISQTTPFDKIWFVDDGAGDCGHLVGLYPEVSFILREKNLGIVDNFQDMLLNHVDTDFVMFLGADNWLSLSTVHELSECLQDFNGAFTVGIITYDIVVTGILRDEIFRFYSHEMRHHPDGYYWSRLNKHHGSMLYRTALAKQVGGYAHNRTSERTDEDLNLWDKMVKANAVIRHVQGGLLYYRRHRENFNKY